MTSSAVDHRAASRWDRAATFTIFLALGVCVGAWAAALPSLKAQIGMSDRGLSLALLAGAVGSVVSTVTAGWLTPRLGTGRATLASAVGVVAALSLPALAGSLPLFAMLTFLGGLANGALDVAMNGHASHVETRWRGPIMSSFHGAFSLGGLAGAGIGGFLASLEWSAGAQLRTAAVLAGLLVAAALPALGPGTRPEGPGPALAWPKRSLLGLGAVVMFGLLVEGAMADWSAIYLTSVVGSSTGLAAAGYAAFSLAMAAGRLGGDAIVATLGQRTVVVGGSLIAAAGLMLVVAWPVAAATVPGFALVGIGLSNVVPVVFSAAAARGTSPAAGIATVATVGYAGFLSGPPIIGGIGSVVGLRLAFLVLIAATIVMTALGGGVGARMAVKGSGSRSGRPE